MQAPRNDIVAHDQYKARFEQLNAKLDKILHLLETTTVQALKSGMAPTPVASQPGLHTVAVARPAKLEKQVVDTKALGTVVAKAVAGAKSTTPTKVASKPVAKVASKKVVAKKPVAKRGK
jgi:hypothetical protein